MAETLPDTDGGSLGSRLRARIGSISPFSLVLLGFIGFIGDIFPSLEILQLFHLFWLFAFWPVAALLVGAVTHSLGYGSADAGPRDWLEMGGRWRGLCAFALAVPLSVLNPLAFRQDLMQLLGSLVAIIRHRGSLPDPETHGQSTEYRLPVEGTWTVLNGSPVKEYSHSWFPATQRYAHDFVLTDDNGRSRPENTDTSLENYYCYDQPVLAPADGIVVDVHDGDPELGRAGGFSHPLKRSLTGNRVTVRHAEGEYSSLVHLVPGSIEVEPGNRVERGERIGRCGHSGNSSEPHLHFQSHDHPAFEISAGLPVRFDDVSVDAPGRDVAEATGWDEPDGSSGRYVHVGQRVTQTADPDSPQGDDTTAGSRVGVAQELVESRVFARVANGIAVGGIVTVLAGFVVSSQLAIAVALAGLALLVTAHQVTNTVFSSDSTPRGLLGTDDGVAVAAALVGGPEIANTLPEFGPGASGAGVFAIGFVLYVAVWEYERRKVLPSVS